MVQLRPDSGQALEARTSIVVARNRAEDYEGATMVIEELFVKFGDREGMAAVATDLGDRCRRLYGRSDQARRLYGEVVKRWPQDGRATP